jgi:hypothetical protein
VLSPKREVDSERPKWVCVARICLKVRGAKIENSEQRIDAMDLVTRHLQDSRGEMWSLFEQS